MYTIYKHKNKVSGKCYIGQTKYSMEHRWKQHLQTTNHRTKNSYPFLKAIKKYGKDAWISEVLAIIPSKEGANTLEKYYIKKYDSFKNGYNATLGGDYFDGYTHPKGVDSPSTDTSQYTLYHKNLPAFVGTRAMFCNKYKATTDAFSRLVHGKLRRLKGFAFTKENALCDRLTKPRIVSKEETFTKFYTSFWKPILKASEATYLKKDQKLQTPIEKCVTKKKKSVRLLKSNPTKGKTRPQYVKDAVSKRRRAEADQTLRTWIHPKHGVVSKIKSIDLRDKFPELLISHLKKITDYNPSYQSHKGWRLHEP